MKTAAERQANLRELDRWLEEHRVQAFFLSVGTAIFLLELSVLVRMAVEAVAGR